MSTPVVVCQPASAVVGGALLTYDSGWLTMVQTGGGVGGRRAVAAGGTAAAGGETGEGGGLWG